MRREWSLDHWLTQVLEDSERMPVMSALDLLPESARVAAMDRMRRVGGTTLHWRYEHEGNDGLKQMVRDAISPRARSAAMHETGFVTASKESKCQESER